MRRRRWFVFVTTPPREQGGFLGQPPLQGRGTGLPRLFAPLAPSGPAVSEDGNRFDSPHGVSCWLSPGSRGLVTEALPGGNDSRSVAQACGRVLDSFLLFIIGGRRFLRRREVMVSQPRFEV